MTATAMDDRVRSLAEALLSAARTDAAGMTHRAAEASALMLDDARRQADEILAEARRQGEADAAALQAAGRAAAHRDARTRSLRVQREIYEQLREHCLSRSSALAAKPAYAQLRSRLVQAAHGFLGEEAVIRDADGGGVFAEVAGRRLDLSMARFVDLAVSELGWQLFDGAGTAAPAAEPSGGTP
jgi:vacuolar-type H+-ATPase subunit E/Vma4